ncbi:hypothetical protein SAMN05660359_03731 [Geodermatophilus obscurus]|uniref:DUF4126 domain-containing protein n=1 Tax=Geodermatophilus obscurus TaxID=1861 RepID=A0A1I5HI52_9ACTN|nr:hypothetical protein [Geodermatophilus obscurus]SFO47710.1 hypothetical protein SAMN05660359_03731 [Geodermatophilus obscurus]
MTGSVARGLAAGAVGTTVLQTVTYLDVLWRGRTPGAVPERVVDALAARLGRKTPDGHRRAALGALLDVGTGLGVGVLASATRSHGARFSGPAGAVVTGAVAMAAADGPAAALGVTDPRTRSAADWAAAAVPHLAYGAALHGVVSAVPTAREQRDRRTPAPAGLVLRSAVLGVATGGRSSLALAGPALTDRRTRPSIRAGALAAVGGELVADKLPGTPARTSPQSLPARLLGGAGGAGRLAGREGANAAVPVTVGLLGALAGSFGGVAWRRWASRRVPDWQAALVEDALALALAAAACVPGRTNGGRARLRVVRA